MVVYTLLLSISFLFFGIILILVGATRWRRLTGLGRRVILTGGGTGGHVNPALAIAEGIKNREQETQFLYVGVRGKAETVIVGKAGYPLRYVSSEGFPGLRPSLRTLRFVVRLGFGVLQSIWILFRFAPQWIVATGGYVSAPIIIATIILKTLRIAPTRIFLHEQNSVPGQLNAVLGKWVDKVLLTFPQTLSFFPRNGVVVGYPIRTSIVPRPREIALKNLPFTVSNGRQVVFAFGGSQGARTINRALVDALPHLIPHRDRLFIVHGMGLASSEGYNAVADTEGRLQRMITPEQRNLLDEFYYRQDYFHNIADVYSISDLVVCRSGAGSLNEISRLGIPALLIPKANLPGDHQVMNARAMKCGGAAELLFEDTILENGVVLEKLEGRLLADRILRLLGDRERLHRMAQRSTQFLRKQAVERILSELYEDHSFDNGIGYHAEPFKPLLSNNRLLELLSRAYQRSPEQYDPVVVVGDAADVVYYRHRAAGLLSHKMWQDRNLGVKLIGYTRYHEKIPTLLHMLSDRTPAGRIQRFFGGDFAEVGFIRRNIVAALQVLNQIDPDIEASLLKAAEDPYFEVRAQVCRAVVHFGPLLVKRDQWFDAMKNGINDRCFEVVVEAAKAMGEIGDDARAAGELLNLKEHHFWQVRDAALKGLGRLVDRDIIIPSPSLLSHINSFILTATDFRPHFSIKETYRCLQNSCNQKLRAGREELDPRSFSEHLARKL